jgi:hypothetical protein
MARLRIVLLYVVVPALGVATAWQTFAAVRSGWRFGVSADQAEVKIHDFASHLTFAKTFWRGDGGYGVEDHLRVRLLADDAAGPRASLPAADGFGLLRVDAAGVRRRVVDGAALSDPRGTDGLH